MGQLFEAFPLLESERLVIRKMTEDDVDALSEITNNDLVYRYIPPFLYKKAETTFWLPSGIWAGEILRKRKRSLPVSIFGQNRTS